MSHARRAVPKRKWPIPLTLGIVAAVLIGGIAVAGQLRGSDDARPTPTASAPSGEATGNAQPSPPTAQGTTPAAACAREIAAGEALVKAARTAAGHWREHVEARTNLLSGKNSLATTSAIWKRTRLAGPTDLATLASAETAQAQARGGCSAISGAAAEPCRQRLAALDAAASAGRAASRDWANHLSMMAAYAADAFSAEHAQHQWVAAWKGAPKNLNAFKRADEALARAPGCQPS
jgi:hypothetical protein